MLVGLTGGIGCGKSTALKIFSGLDWSTFDSDLICHGLYEDRQGKVFKAVSDKWGSRILDEEGLIDRRAVADIVFSDSRELAWLNSVVHPAVLEKAREMAEERTWAMFDVPLLFEAGWEKEFDLTITVWSTPEIQRERLESRGWSESEIDRRMESQMPADEKLGKADFGIVNNGGTDQLLRQCMMINEKLKHNNLKER